MINTPHCATNTLKRANETPKDTNGERENANANSFEEMKNAIPPTNIQNKNQRMIFPGYRKKATTIAQNAACMAASTACSCTPMFISPEPVLFKSTLAIREDCASVLRTLLGADTSLRAADCE